MRLKASDHIFHRCCAAVRLRPAGFGLQMLDCVRPRLRFWDDIRRVMRPQRGSGDQCDEQAQCTDDRGGVFPPTSRSCTAPLHNATAYKTRPALHLSSDCETAVRSLTLGCAWSQHWCARPNSISWSAPNARLTGMGEDIARCLQRHDDSWALTMKCSVPQARSCTSASDCG